MNCRHCGRALRHTLVDLGFAPPSNAYLQAGDLARAEVHYPLKVRVCDGCWLVQTEDYARADALFDASYAYFSSTSAGWLRHARTYALEMRERLGLGVDSLVIEVASNDGYLLRNFVEFGVPCLGIEPTASTAAAARALGIPVLQQFFGEALGQELAQTERQADLIAGNNVYAHVPDINDFTRGLRHALKPGGTITLEFPHLLQLLAHSQFDTIYHEHFSYLSLQTVCRIFAAAGLRVFDVETLPTHGGSLRVFGCHVDDPRADGPAVQDILQAEVEAGLDGLAAYSTLQSRAETIKRDLLRFLLDQRDAGKAVVAYGAAAKGNTLLNFAGVRPDLLGAVADAAPAKQGKFLPGSHIPVIAPAELSTLRPDYVLILPWNIADEVMEQQAGLRAQGARFVVAVPHLRVL